jgi:hypothetical protein
LLAARATLAANVPLLDSFLGWHGRISRAEQVDLLPFFCEDIHDVSEIVECIAYQSLSLNQPTEGSPTEGRLALAYGLPCPEITTAR